MFKKCLLPGTFAGGMKLLAKACLFHGDGCRDDKYTGYRRGGGHQGVFTPGMSALARLAMGMLAAEGMIAVARWP